METHWMETYLTQTYLMDEYQKNLKSTNPLSLQPLQLNLMLRVHLGVQVEADRRLKGFNILSWATL